MDIFDLVAKLSLDDSGFKSGIDGAKSALSSIGSAAVKGVKVAAGAVAAATTAAAGATTALAKSAVESYADYEQLTGGIETLYKDSYGKVMEYAKNAYKNAGMSANEYMDTAIQSGAAMLKAVGGDTERAAELTNRSIEDMSDNVNKMGTSMEAVQNAYRGFSRGNFTMLDNLALGFAGTKEGMKELLATAQELSGVTYDIESYADIVEAIHVVQENMGITGTTAEEAAKTVSGSLNMMKKAWANLVTGLADPDADLAPLITKFTSSAELFLKNVMPVVERVAGNIADTIRLMAPKIIEKIPKYFENAAPKITTAVSSMLGTMLQIIPQIGAIIIKQLPDLFDQVTDIFTENSDTFESAGNKIVMLFGRGLDTDMSGLSEKSSAMIDKLADGFEKAAPDIEIAARGIIFRILDFISGNTDSLIDAGVIIVGAVVGGISRTIDTVAEGAHDIVLGILQGLTEHSDEITGGAYDLVSNLIDGLATFSEDLIPAAATLVTSLIDGLLEEDNLNRLIESAGNLVNTLLDGMLAADDIILEKIPQLTEKIKDGILGNVEPISEAAGEIIGKLIAFLLEHPDLIQSGGEGMVQQLIKGLVSSFSIGELAEAAWSIIKSFLSGLTNGFSDLFFAGQDAVTEIGKGVDAQKKDAEEWGMSLVDFMISGISKRHPLLAKALSGIATSMVTSSQKTQQVSRAANESTNLSTRRTSSSNSVLGRNYNNTLNSSPQEKNVTVNLQLDRTQLGKTTFSLYNEENKKVGVKLSDG